MRNPTLKLWTQVCAAAGLVLLAGQSQAQTVTTIGGGYPTAPYSGDQDGPTLNARFNQPSGLALDSAGNYLFVADYSNNVVRIITKPGNTTASSTATFTNSFFTNVTRGISRPVAVAVDAATNVYVLNQGNGTNGNVLQFNAVSLGYPTLVATNAARLTNATAMAMDGLTNLFVVVGGNTVLRITPPNAVSVVGVITNPGTYLQGIAVMDNGQLALSDAGTNSGIWLMNPGGNPFGNATKLAGFNGIGDNPDNWPVPAANAIFNHPANLAKAGSGILVITDSGNNRVKLLNTISLTVTLLYGVNSNYWGNPATTSDKYPGWLDGASGTLAGYAESRQPFGIVVAPDGSVFAAEDFYHVLRHITATGLSAPQPGYPPFFNGPTGIALDSSGSTLYIADYTNNAVEKLNLGNNQTTPFLTSTNGISHPASVLVDTNNNLYVLNQNAGSNGSILEFDTFGNLLETNVTGLNQPTALTMDANGNLFITEQAGNLKVLFPSGVINTLVTINTNASVQLQGIALFDDGMIAVSDAGNHVVWIVNPLTKNISRLTGQIGVSGTTLGSSNVAKLYQPYQLARAGNNQLVIADYGNNRLVTANRAGAITNVMASTNSLIWFGHPNDPSAGSTLPMALPTGLAVSSSGLVYDSEPTNEAVRRLTAALAPAPPAPIVTLPFFANPQGIAFDNIGDYLFIADFANNAVQQLDLVANTTSTFLSAADGILNPVSVLVDTNENIFVLNQGTSGNGSILEFDSYGNAYGPIVTGLNQPTAFMMDGSGNLFITEQAGNLRAFGAGVSNTIVTITNANVSLQGIAVFDDGNLAVSDAGNQVIWTINPITKVVTKLTGQLGVSGAAVGASNFAKLNQPHQLVRVGGNQIVAADYGNNRLVLIQRNGTVITNNTTYHLNSSTASIWFGQNGDPITSGSAKFVPMVLPSGITADASGNIFASETYYEDIRKLTGTGLTSPTFDPGVPLPFYAGPAGIALNTASSVLYATDPANNLVSSLTLGNNLTTVYLTASNGLNAPIDVALDSNDNLYVLNQGTGTNGSILTFDKYRNLLATNAANLSLPTAMTFDKAGDIYVAGKAGAVQLFYTTGSNTVLAVVTNNPNVQLGGIALLDDGTIVVSDTSNHVIWQIQPLNHMVSLFTGQIGSSGSVFGPPAYAKLNHPKRLVRAAGDLLVAADSGNNQVVVINSSGAITSALSATNGSIWFGLAGDPYAATYVPMASPNGLALSTAGAVFTSEDIYKDIREITGTGLSQLGLGGGGGTGTNAVIIPPALSPNAGYFPMGQEILVTSPNPNVYYTMDGTDPTTNSAPVGIIGNIGHIHWFNTTNDLTWLRVKAFVGGTNASATVSGQPVATNSIGISTDFNPMLQAGIGASIVIPVVCNLAVNQQIKSYQLRCEIYPINNSNTPIILPLSIIPTNDFVPVVTAIQNGSIGTFTAAFYSLGLTNGIAYSTAITNGNNGNTSFKNYAVVQMLEVQIPYTANVGDTYGLNILYPSATSDGYNAGVPLTPMAPATILVTNLPYVVGDSASAAGTWYNAGTYGDDNLDNSDVNQAFYASSGLRVPYAFSDAFNALDAYPPDGNGYVGGDGQIRFLDWQTILERSLRLDTNDWSRAWSAGGYLVDVVTNLVVPHLLTAKPSVKTNSVVSPWYRQALVGGNSISYASPGSPVNVPIYVKLQNGSTLSGLQFRTVVTPQNGAPAVAGSPQLFLAAGVSTPYLQQSFKAAEAAFGWQLGSFGFQSRSSNFLGWVSFTIPASAQSGQTYTVSFANADGSPDLNTQYDFESRTATVTVNAASPPTAICSDEWKIHFFGSSTNPAAADMADPDGDGMPNWVEFLAGTDPTSAQSKLQVGGSWLTTKGQHQMNLSWLTAPGRAYELQWSSNLAGSAWNTLTTVSGDGTATNTADANPTGTTRYYRLHILP